MTDRYCLRCESKLNRPHPEHANYVVAADFVEQEPRVVHYAMLNSEKSLQRLNELDELLPDKDRQAINAEIARADAPKTIEIPDGKEIVRGKGGETETTKYKKVPFSVPNSEYLYVEVDDPHYGLDDDDVAAVFPVVEDRPVQKTGLVCRNCVADDDKIIWGPDKE